MQLAASIALNVNVSRAEKGEEGGNYAVIDINIFSHPCALRDQFHSFKRFSRR